MLRLCSVALCDGEQCCVQGNYIPHLPKIHPHYHTSTERLFSEPLPFCGRAVPRSAAVNSFALPQWKQLQWKQSQWKQSQLQLPPAQPRSQKNPSAFGL